MKPDKNGNEHCVRLINWTMVITVPLMFPLLIIVVFIVISLWPYLHLIGVILLVSLLVAALVGKVYLVFWLYCKVGMMLAERRRATLHSRVIIAGEVVAFPHGDGSFTHLSAIHNGGMLPEPKEDTEEIMPELPTKQAEIPWYDIVDMHFKQGMSLRAIVAQTGKPYSQVQKVCKEWEDKLK
jgi:hypothetical protein